MKRTDLIRELERAGCQLLRHGGNHDIYVNPINTRKAADRDTGKSKRVCVA
jgi:predicted RNA binding protein YcfA (HicA-like mRNA interferase family)